MIAGGTGNAVARYSGQWPVVSGLWGKQWGVESGGNSGEWLVESEEKKMAGMSELRSPAGS